MKEWTKWPNQDTNPQLLDSKVSPHPTPPWGGPKTATEQLWFPSPGSVLPSHPHPQSQKYFRWRTLYTGWQFFFPSHQANGKNFSTQSLHSFPDTYQGLFIPHFWSTVCSTSFLNFGCWVVSPSIPSPSLQPTATVCLLAVITELALHLTLTSFWTPLWVGLVLWAFIQMNFLLCLFFLDFPPAPKLMS